MYILKIQMTYISIRKLYVRLKLYFAYKYNFYVEIVFSIKNLYMATWEVKFQLQSVSARKTDDWIIAI